VIKNVLGLPVRVGSWVLPSMLYGTVCDFDASIQSCPNGVDLSFLVVVEVVIAPAAPKLTYYLLADSRDPERCDTGLGGPGPRNMSLSACCENQSKGETT